MSTIQETNKPIIEGGAEKVFTGEVSHETTLFAEPIGEFAGLVITNSLVTSWIAVAVIVIIGIALRLKLSKIPRGLQNVAELFVEGALSLCDQVTQDRKLSLKIFPGAAVIFIFVLINNWLGLVPGVGAFGVIERTATNAVFVPWLRGGTADLNTTLALALLTVIGANVFGVVSIGAWKTFNKYINIKALLAIPKKIMKDPTIIIVSPITFFVGIIEVVGEMAKIASLSFRLFGNVFAGEVLLASMTALFAYALPIPFIFLEILVGFIQALIFSMLTMVYCTIAAQDHDHDENEHAHEAAHA